MELVVVAADQGGEILEEASRQITEVTGMDILIDQHRRVMSVVKLFASFQLISVVLLLAKVLTYFFMTISFF